MNAIASSSAARLAPLPTPAATPAAASATPAAAAGDLLGAMRPAMDAAFQVGRPANASDATSIVGMGAGYINGASSTIARLDEGIQRRTREIEQLQLGDPAAAQEQQGQLDMLLRLRDRIQLSMERVGDILAGTDRPDIGTELDLLEQRRGLTASVAAPGAPAASAVAGMYAAGS